MDMARTITATLILLALNILIWGLIIYLLILAIKALRKYLKTSNVRKEQSIVRKSLGETIKEQRTRCKMTQEFVAESIGVSRQAVSKWESGASDPSTSNLFSLAKLFGVPVEELLRGVNPDA